MRWPAYPKYRPTGVEWFEEIPENWDTYRVGDLATKVGSGKTPRGGAETYQEEGVLLIRSQNVHDTGLRLSDAVFIDESIDEEMKETRVIPGDVLLNITGASLGRCSIAPEGLPPANVNQHVCIVRVKPSIACARFVQRSLSARSVQEQIFSYENGSSREGLNFGQVRGLRLALPSLPEQKRIADFVDREAAKIETLTEKKRTLIERMKEKRTALISGTVTRGLPPEAARAAGLDPHPQLKPTGIDWLGDVPAHWDVVRLGRRIVLQRGVDITKDEQSEGVVPVVSSGGVSSYHDRALAKGPGVVVGRKGTAGAVYYIPDDFWPHDTTLWVKEFFGGHPKYVFYKLLSMDLASFDTGSANPTVNRNLVHPVFVSWPPRAEQAAIAEFLSAETARIDDLVAKVESAIERLKEYRTALITAAVTGRIDVRGAHQ